MDLEQEKLNLIEEIIRNDKKFSNNEDLYDDFFNETCERSIGIINTISSNDILKPYLKKVVTTSIINVLKNSGRLRRSSNGYIATKEMPTEELSYSNVEVSYTRFTVEETPEDIVIKKDTIDRIANLVHEINCTNPDKQYLQIFKYRYEDGMTQKEIADELNLSQSEISKRLFKLMKNIKQIFY